MQLEGRVALVTGAGSGIGKAAALLLAREGAKIGALGRTEEELRETVERTAHAYDGSATQAPLLHVEYTILPATTVEARVGQSADDAEEAVATSNVERNSTRLDIGDYPHWEGNQIVGLRFAGLALPEGATITYAYVEFSAAQSESGTTTLTFRAQASDNATAFTWSDGSVSSRPTTSASVAWSNVPAWSSGTLYRSPNLASLLQEVVDRPGWASGNALALVVSGTGERTAHAYDGSATQAPLLHVEYTILPSATVEARVGQSADDAEEAVATSHVERNSSRLDIGDYAFWEGNQLGGLRFTGMALPAGATISRAYVELTAAQSESGTTTLTFRAQASDNAAAFTWSDGSVSNRPTTSASVTWANVPAWTSSGSYRSPDLSDLIQEVVNRPGWTSGNALALIVTGTGERTAHAYDGSATQAPLLHVEYSTLEGTITDTQVLSYSYDDLHRLTDASYGTDEHFAYSYDAVGNRTVMTDALGIHAYSYDAANRLTTVDSIPYSYDANGNLFFDGAFTYAYDAANRLTSVTGNGSTSTYLYDGLDQRVAQTVNGATTQYTLDVAGGLPEVIAATTGAATTRYVQVGGQLLAQHDSGTWAYVLPDHLGSVRQLGDGAGDVTLAQGYAPFGEGLGGAGTGGRVFGFTGEQEDATGLVYLRARYYESGADGSRRQIPSKAGADPRPENSGSPTVCRVGP